MLRTLSKTVFLLLLIAAGSVGLMLYYSHSEAQRRIDELSRQLEQKKQIIQRLQTDRRVAKILVVEQSGRGGEMLTTLLMQEYTREGTVLPARRFTIRGNEAHFDAEVIKFKDAYVQADDALRGQSILLFTRVYGSRQAPEEGFAIDAPGEIPEIYKGADPRTTQFELDLWKNFWSLYNDKAAREARGIRGLHGQGLFGQLEKNHIYTIELRPDGDGTLTEEPIEPIYQNALGK